VIDAFVDRIERRLEQRLHDHAATPPDLPRQAFVIALSSLGVAIPMLGIAGGIAGLAGIIAVCAALVLVNVIARL
jgi:hypothetical protein